MPITGHDALAYPRAEPRSRAGFRVVSSRTMCAQRNEREPGLAQLQEPSPQDPSPPLLVPSAGAPSGAASAGAGCSSAGAASPPVVSAGAPSSAAGGSSELPQAAKPVSPAAAARMSSLFLSPVFMFIPPIESLFDERTRDA